MTDLALLLYDKNDIAHSVVPERLRFTKDFFGGIDVEMSFFLPRSLHLDYPEIGHGQKAELWYGWERKFLGEQRLVNESKQGGKEGFDIRCFGYRVFLEDFGYGGKGKLWCDTRYSEWRPARKADHNDYRSSTRQLDRNNRLQILYAEGAVVYQNKKYGGYVYECGYDEVKRITFDYELQCDINFLAELVSYNASFGAKNIEWSKTADGTGSADVTLSTERPIIVFRARDTSNAGYWGEDHYLRITDLKVFGSTDISPVSSDIANDIVDQLNSDTLISSDKGLVETISLELLPLVWEEGETCYDAFKTVAFHGDSSHKLFGWGIESGGDRVFIQKPDYTQVRYIVPPSDANRIERSSLTIEDYITEGWGMYRNRKGFRKFTDKYYVHITPSGIAVNTTATGNDLASTIYGVKRSAVVDMGTVTSAMATQAIQWYLMDNGYPLSRVSISAQSPVIDLNQGGAKVLPIELEMGYLCQIPWLRAVDVDGASGSDIREWETTFLLKGMEYNDASKTARLILERDTESFARMLGYIKKREAAEDVG